MLLRRRGYVPWSVPLSIASHEEVARHYAVSGVNLAEDVADRIRAGTLTWERYGGVHPGRPGNELCAALIEGLLTRAWKEKLPADAAAEKHRLPDAPLDANHYGAGRACLEPIASRLPGEYHSHLLELRLRI